MTASILRRIREALRGKPRVAIDEEALREKRSDAAGVGRSDTNAPVDWVKPYDEGKPKQ